ncbi:MAG: hypothetical protein HY759_01220 [Nitrospirae bacterium]|nr:hypothetical protein [Nitrospirota bacterium]
MDYFISTVTEQEISREKQKARDLRKTRWWKRKCSGGRCYYCGSKDFVTFYFQGNCGIIEF